MAQERARGKARARPRRLFVVEIFPDVRARSLRSTSASSIYSRTGKSTLAAEHERAPGVAEVIRDCEERARCEARARLMVDCSDAGDVRTRRASCVLGWPKKVALKSDCCWPLLKPSPLSPWNFFLSCFSSS